MTLKKVQTGMGFPALRPFEAKLSGDVTILSEPKFIATKFTDGQETQCIMDVKLIKTPDEETYKDEGTQKDDRAKRLETENRTWFVNNKSFNHLIDTIGDDESKYPERKITLEIHDQMVKGKQTDVIYAKGAV